MPVCPLVLEVEAGRPLEILLCAGDVFALAGAAEDAVADELDVHEAVFVAAG